VAPGLSSRRGPLLVIADCLDLLGLAVVDAPCGFGGLLLNLLFALAVKGNELIA